jgi:hypothetical protein
MLRCSDGCDRSSSSRAARTLAAEIEIRDETPLYSRSGPGTTTVTDIETLMGGAVG